MADVVIMNKVDTADPKDIAAVRKNIKTVNPNATIIEAASPITVDNPSIIKGKRVLVIEDGPTLTHGNMAYGAGTIASKRLGASELVDPRPYAVGSIRAVFDKYTHLGPLLPAMGYGDAQIGELEETISKTPCDLIVVGTPIDLRKILQLSKPATRVRYELQETGETGLEDILAQRFPRA
jgi:predicted GTPase